MCPMGILPNVQQNEPIEKETKVSSEKFGANWVTLGVERRLDVLYKQHLEY